MSDIEAGARAPDAPGATGQTVSRAADAAGSAAADVKDTAKTQARQVGGEVKVQARNVASDVRDTVTRQARTQNDRLADGIRRMADDLERMTDERGGSPAATVVSRIAGAGRQAADYLSAHGPEGVLSDVQDFARRRPGAFLATALAAGFLAGRIGKGVMNASQSQSSRTKPSDDAFVSGVPGYQAQPYAEPGYTQTGYTQTGYPQTGYTGGGYAEPAYSEPGYTTPAAPGTTTGSTEYVSTGTGTPVPLPDEPPLLPEQGRTNEGRP